MSTGRAASLAAPVVRPTPFEVIRSLCERELGYHEGRSHGRWNNVTKYDSKVPGFEWMDNELNAGQPWCALYASHIYLETARACRALALKGELWFPSPGVDCDTQAKKYKKAGRWTEYPVLGGQVFFGSPRDLNHTGIVLGYDANNIYTSEGNTNGNGSREGDGVYRKVHPRRIARVVGYGIPKLGAPVRTPDPKWKGKK